MSPNAEKMSSTLEKPLPAALLAAQAVEAEAVVARALFLVGEHLIRARRFLEAVLGRLVIRVVIRVELLREAVVRLLQIGLARAPFDPEYFI